MLNFLKIIIETLVEVRRIRGEHIAAKYLKGN